MEKLRLHCERFPGQPLLDTAVSRAILQGVAEGRLPATLRIYRPDDVLAFSILDRSTQGFEAATEIARAHGFAPVMRLAGGRAAVFHSETLAFAWSRPTSDLREGIEARYQEMGEILVTALCRLGVDARIGELTGEYCPGRFSVNAGGRLKLAGVGQRVVRGAAHIGGVVVVGESRRVREPLIPIYKELRQPFDPATTGAIEDVVPAVAVCEFAATLQQVFETRFDLEPAALDPATRARAESLAPEHDPRATPKKSGARLLSGVPKGVQESS